MCNWFRFNGKAKDQIQKVLFLSSTPMYKEEMRFINKQVKQNGKTCIYQYHVGQYLPDWHPWDNLNDFFVSNRLTNGCREFLAIELPWIQHVFGKIRNINKTKRSLTHLGLEFPDAYLIQIEHEQGYAEIINEYAYEKEIEEFFEVIQGKEPIYGFEQDIETLKIIDKIES